MKVLIIGANASGMTVAGRLNRERKSISITVYEKREYISFGACGLPYYIGGEFDDPNLMISRTVESYESTNINIKIKCEVIGIDYTNKLIKFIENGEIKFDNYDHLVISTGAYPVQLKTSKNIKTCNNICHLNSLEDGEIIRKIGNDINAKNIVVVGAGHIGLECVEAFRHKNKNITIIESNSSFLGNIFDYEISQKLYEEAINNNIKVFLKSKIVDLKIKNNYISKVILDNNTEIDCDFLVVAIGVKPATDWVGDEIKKMPNGAIIVDKYGQTNIDNVWSLGDSATIKDFITNKNIYVPLATIARKTARVIANNILGYKTEVYGSLKTSMLRFFSLSCVRTGLTEREADIENISYEKVVIKDKDRTNYVINQNDIMLELIFNKKNRNIIGGQIVGKGDSILRIHSIIDMIWNRVIVDEKLLQLDLPYSPPFARPIDIIYIALSKLIKME